jgi:hypothetical protein
MTSLKYWPEQSFWMQRTNRSLALDRAPDSIDEQCEACDQLKCQKYDEGH